MPHLIILPSVDRIVGCFHFPILVTSSAIIMAMKHLYDMLQVTDTLQ